MSKRIQKIGKYPPGSFRTRKQAKDYLKTAFSKNVIHRVVPSSFYNTAGQRIPCFSIQFVGYKDDKPYKR